MKAKYEAGKQVYATHRIIGTEVGTGTPVTIVEPYTARGEETRYLVRTPGGFKVYCYESDLDSADPFARAES